MEMLLTGEMIDAAAAKDFGLVNRVVPREYLTQIVNKYAQTIASKSPSTLKLGKEAFYRQAEMGLADAYDYASPRDGREPARRGRQGRHRRLHREAQAGVEGRVAGRWNRASPSSPSPPMISIAPCASTRRMGLKRHAGITEGVAFFQMGGAILGLFPRKDAEADSGRHVRQGAVRRLSRLQHALRRRGRRGACRCRKGGRAASSSLPAALSGAAGTAISPTPTAMSGKSLTIQPSRSTRPATSRCRTDCLRDWRNACVLIDGARNG